MGFRVCTEHEKLEGVPPVGGTPFCYADMDRAHMNRTKVLWPSGDQTGRVRRASVKVNSIAPPMVLKTSVVHADTCLDQSERGALRSGQSRNHGNDFDCSRLGGCRRQFP